MWRAFIFGLLLSLGARVVYAQGKITDATTLRLGAGLSSSDYACTGCEINAETGFSAFVSGTHALGRLFTAGLEGTLSHASGDQADVTLLSALASAGLRGGSGAPVWATVGLGWVWYSGTGPNSNGPALSVRAGADVPVGPRLALTPYVGYLTMIAHDGPRVITGPISLPGDPGVPTRVASLQFGLAITLTP